MASNQDQLIGLIAEMEDYYFEPLLEKIEERDFEVLVEKWLARFVTIASSIPANVGRESIQHRVKETLEFYKAHTLNSDRKARCISSIVGHFYRDGMPLLTQS